MILATLVFAVAVSQKDISPPIVTQRTPPPVFIPTPVDPNPKASTKFYGMVSGWELRIDPTLAGGCFAIRYFEDGTVFRFGFNIKSQALYIILANEKWKSLELNKTYQLSFAFGGEDPYVGTATAVTFGRSTTNLYIAFKGVDVVDDFMTESQVAVSYRSSPMAMLSLSGSNSAGRSLLTCQRSQGYDVDPFKIPDVPTSKETDPFAT